MLKKGKPGPSLGASQGPGDDEVKSRLETLEGADAIYQTSFEELRQGLDEQKQQLEDQLAAVNEQVEYSIEQASKRQVDELLGLRRERESSEAKLKTALDGLSAVSAELASVKEALGRGLAEFAAKQQKAEEDARAAVDAKLKALSEKAKCRCGDVEACFAGKLDAQKAEAEVSLQQVAAQLTTRCELLQGGMDGLTSEAAADQARLEKRVAETEAFVVRSMEEMQQQVQAELQASVSKLAAAQRQQFESIDRDLEANVAAMRKAVELAENVFTRSVVWQARGFKKRLRDLIHEDDQIIMSPGFYISSLPEIKLEIQLAARDAAGDASAFGPSLPLPGSCSIGVWAPAGLRAVFRITVGEGRDAVSRRYEHDFEAESRRLRDASGRVLFVVQNFCRLNQVWMRNEDRVRVFFELLDFQSEPMTVLPALLPLPRGASVAKLEDGTDPLGGEVAAAAPGPPGELPPSPAGPRPGTAPSPPGTAAMASTMLPTHGEDGGRRPALAADEEELLDEAASPSKQSPSDCLQYFRCATSQELVQERLQSELHAVKNRSVRRVEWRLEGCSRLLECRPGEAIDSPIFSAAGLERIQFHFYPRDTAATGTSSQPCAIFVSGPCKTSLKAMLWVGSFSRQLEHRFQKRGELGGRSRFCQLDKQVDCTDSVVLALDIEEVETDMPEQPQMSLCLRDTRTPASVQGGVARPPSVTSPVRGTKGLLSMKKEDPSKTEEFVRCVSLPTLNARQLKLPLAMKSRPA